MPLTTFSYPPVDEMIHGTLVRDPCRWLEERDNPDTEVWIEDQQRRCDHYFESCIHLGALRDHVRDYLNVEVVDQPAKIADHYFYCRRNKDEEQASIYVRNATDGIERQLIASDVLGRFASVSIYRISDDGSLLAYALRQGGSDRRSIHVVEVDSGRVFEDLIGNGYARGFSFISERRGFYYCHEREGHIGDHEIIRHRFDNTLPDEVIFQTPRSIGSRLVLIDDKENLGAVHIRLADNVEVMDFWIAPRSHPMDWHPIFQNRRLPFSPILKHGRIFGLRYENAPNGVLVELDHYGRELRTIVPEQDGVMRQMVFTADGVFIHVLKGLSSTIQRWNFEGDRLESLKIPTDGSIQLLPAETEVADSIFYSYESFTQSLAIFEYETSNHATSLWHKRETPAGRLRTSIRHADYPSSDGVRIPITLVYGGQTNLKSLNPVILTGYGGFGVSMTPQFSILVTIMMELGAVFALPHIRGGGELGKAWHDAARGRSRQVAYNDFLAAAGWLHSEGITTPDRLGIFGGSNSGLLVGVALTQRPELFRAVLCIAPLLDMVRYHRFDQALKWRREYGIADDPDDFLALYSYSPYHHIRDDVDYPSVLFVSGDADDRCNPAHVRKAAQRLQQSRAQILPIIVDYSKERGHAPLLPLSIRVDALARRIAFLCRELNMPVFFRNHHE